MYNAPDCQIPPSCLRSPRLSSGRVTIAYALSGATPPRMPCVICTRSVVLVALTGIYYAASESRTGVVSPLVASPIHRKMYWRFRAQPPPARFYPGRTLCDLDPHCAAAFSIRALFPDVSRFQGTRRHSSPYSALTHDDVPTWVRLLTLSHRLGVAPFILPALPHSAYIQRQRFRQTRPGLVLHVTASQGDAVP